MPRNPLDIEASWATQGLNPVSTPSWVVIRHVEYRVVLSQIPLAGHDTYDAVMSYRTCRAYISECLSSIIVIFRR